MRAVNLIPSEERRGAGGAAGRSGGAAYIVLGALAALVVMAGAYVLAGNKVDNKKAQLAQVTQQAQAAEAKAQSLASYTKFTDLRSRRVQTVSQLADSRFDWAHALHEVARVLPENAWLTSMAASTSPAVSVGGGGGGGGLRGALPVPAITISGCTTSQRSVAKMMVRMRLIDGVQRVSLSDATKGESSGGATPSAGAGAGGGDCRGGHAKYPQFDMVVFFRAQAPAPTATVPGAAGTSSTTPSSTSTTTPASTAPTSASGGTTP